MEKTTETSSLRTLLALGALIVVVLIIAFAFMALRPGNDALFPGATTPEVQEPVSYVCPDGSMYVALHKSSTVIEVAEMDYTLDANSGYYTNELSPISFIHSGETLQVSTGGDVVATCFSGSEPAAIDDAGAEEDTASNEDAA